MKQRTDKAFGINQQRGFWLRCFLEQEKEILLLLLGLATICGTDFSLYPL